MERLDKFTVMAVRGEDDANILDFKEVFGVEFGAAAMVKQSFGHRSRQAENAGVVCIRFTTPNHTETSVGFYYPDSVMSHLLGGKRVIIVSDHPWAKEGDEGNVYEYQSGLGISWKTGETFVSADGKDPVGETVQTSFDVHGNLHKVVIPPRPDGGLRPSTEYFVTVRRTDRDHGDLPPLGLSYKGSDDPDRGGEVAAINMNTGGAGIPFVLGDLKGTFYPDTE